MSNKDATHYAIELSPTHEILIGQRPTQDSVALAFAQLYKGTYVYAYPTGWLKWTGKVGRPMFKEISGRILGISQGVIIGKAHLQ